ncbi:MAG: EAL domain-containing protein, partial [Coriobacteriales bacterium]|nr:EAL domain-containing protein [Coriobacteriales bacterium]
VHTKVLGRFESSGGFAALMLTRDVEHMLEAINRELPSADEADGLVLKGGYCKLKSRATFEDAMVRARYALEDIRYTGHAFSRLFDQGIETVYNRRTYVVEHLDEAIARGEIRAYAQSIVRVLTGMICEVEVLARWESEEYGFLRPDEFVPELERRQLIHKLDAEVVRLACKQWSEASKRGINVPFGINLSRLDFELCDMFEVVTNAMLKYNVPVDQVHIEITESALAHSSSKLNEGISKFRKAGFKLYLDDFGSGYSSLQVLEGTSFDVVKLDMSLLREVEENERARVIVADAISMVKRLNLQTLCEGVETYDQYLFLQAVGCEKAQGYYFGKPMRHEEIMAHLDQTASRHETAEMQRYYDSLGKVNLIDGTRTSIYGVEAAHFQGTQPFAIIEIRGQSFKFLSANTAFYRFAQKYGCSRLEDFSHLISRSAPAIRNKILYVASKTQSKRTAQQIDFVIEGSFYTVGLTFVEDSDGKEAYLVEILSVTKYSQFNNFRLLEQSMSFLYTIFKRIDLLDVTDQTWRNIYLNVPRYNALRAGATPQDEIDAFCDTFIHPDDQARFLRFYDLDTVGDRIRQSSTTHVADVFFALSENRYEEQLFMIIPAHMDGHTQYLSCMRDLDLEGLERQRESVAGHLSDDVLLSGILDITERYVFWKDSKLRFLGANSRFLEYYGLSSVEAILGKTDEDLGWTHNPHFAKDEQRVLRGEKVLGATGRTVRADGQMRSISISKMPLWSEGEVIGLVGFMVDTGPYAEHV